MRLFVFLLLSLTFNETYSQDSKRSEKILTYRHGCHGNCNYSYDDTCGLAKDSIIDLIKIVRINDKYYRNDKLLTKQKMDSLNTAITSKLEVIKKLKTDISLDKQAKYVPPIPKCFEFEEYKIYRKGKVLILNVLNHKSNQDGRILLEEEIEIFNKLNMIIK